MEGTASTFMLQALSSLFCSKDKVPMKEKHDQIMSWIDLPLEKRPQFIMG